MIIKLIVISVFILSIFFILSVPLHATSWCFITTTTKNYYFIDLDSIVTNETQITFWVIKMDIETAKVKAKKRCTIDCHFETALVIDDIRYDTNAHVEIMKSYHDNNWYNIHNSSPTQGIAQILCKYGGPRKKIREYLKHPFQIKDNN